MSQTITVPDIGMYPIEITLNNRKYTLQPGTEATVPDGVAKLLEQIVASKPKPAPNGWKDQWATIKDAEQYGGGSGGGDEPELTRVLTATLGEPETEAESVPEGWHVWFLDLTDSGVTVDPDAAAAVLEGGAPVYLGDREHAMTRDSVTGSYLFNAKIEGGVVSRVEEGSDGFAIIIRADTVTLMSTAALTGEDLVLLTDMSDSGSELPAVDASDDGKVLTVIDGAWDKADVYPGPLLFRLTATDDATIFESGVSVQTVANAVLDGTFAYAYDGVFVLVPSQVLETGGTYAVELTAVGGRRIYTSVSGQPKKWELVTGS